jgi:hypothetical protein
MSSSHIVIGGSGGRCAGVLAAGGLRVALVEHELLDQPAPSW